MKGHTHYTVITPMSSRIVYCNDTYSSFPITIIVSFNKSFRWFCSDEYAHVNFVQSNTQMAPRNVEPGWNKCDSNATFKPQLRFIVSQTGLEWLKYCMRALISPQRGWRNTRVNICVVDVKTKPCTTWVLKYARCSPIALLEVAINYCESASRLVVTNSKKNNILE